MLAGVAEAIIVVTPQVCDVRGVCGVCDVRGVCGVCDVRGVRGVCARCVRGVHVHVHVHVRSACTCPCHRAS